MLSLSWNVSPFLRMSSLSSPHAHLPAIFGAIIEVLYLDQTLAHNSSILTLRDFSFALLYLNGDRDKWQSYTLSALEQSFLQLHPLVVYDEIHFSCLI